MFWTNIYTDPTNELAVGTMQTAIGYQCPADGHTPIPKYTPIVKFTQSPLNDPKSKFWQGASC